MADAGGKAGCDAAQIFRQQVTTVASRAETDQLVFSGDRLERGDQLP